jgi:endoglucanase
MGAPPAFAISADSERAEWEAFKARFIASEGRIVDNGNGSVSHSEGQGWGLLLAERFGDRPTFDSILSWTRRNLHRPGDSLHAWRYAPSHQPPVQDLNNASDGDIFIAAALSRAGQRWAQPDYVRMARAIIRDILNLLVHRFGQRTLLLPGLRGFERRGAVVVNPSYYAFPMLADIARLVPSPKWEQLFQDGLILANAGFGRWKLPADWLEFPEGRAGFAPAAAWPARFGFDAVRIPLYLTWAKRADSPACAALARLWLDFPDGNAPAWVDLNSNEVAPYPATLGMKAVARLTFAALNHDEDPRLPSVSESAVYYDAALILLARTAWSETFGS